MNDNQTKNNWNFIHAGSILDSAQFDQQSPSQVQGNLGN